MFLKELDKEIIENKINMLHSFDKISDPINGHRI